MPSLLSRLKNSLHPNHNGDVQDSEASKQPKRALSKDARRRSADSGDDEPNHDEDGLAQRVLGVLRSFRNLNHLKTIGDLALNGVEGQPMDDKTYLMERIIQLAADLPLTTRTSATLTNTFMNQLWTDLQHPPQSYLGPKYIYRMPDGSNNNILWPHLGAAGQPYARTVRPTYMQPIARPDPSEIFDTLLVRKEFTPHPNKISSVLFYVASIIIHDIFHTKHGEYYTSDTSSYLDLAPLYGNSHEDQLTVRTMKDGKLKPDCFFDVRILGFPPGVGCLLIMFNRFHNHVAENLARIDEAGRFSSILKPRGKPTPPDAAELYDEALFQTSRLITTGLYVNIILKDYVRTILNLNRVDSLWSLDPRSDEGKAFFGKDIPEATGNSVSAEFNLVYRWHSTVSKRDEQWTVDALARIMGTKQSPPFGEFLTRLKQWADEAEKLDPLKRNFEGLERTAEGKYADRDLAAIWQASVEDCAGVFGARHVPEILKNVEILGMIQSRSWNLASLNEFRKYFHLKPHEKFEDINSDPVIVEQLKRLYGHPDNVEIYPGVVVEETKVPKKPGSGLCTNFTTSRAILSDAVALVRGDRFYTVDYTPRTLTNWGFNEVNYDLAINYGCVFYKLVLNAFPDQFKENSIYAHYPLVIPSENKTILADLKKAHLYDFSAATLANPSPVVLSSLDACQKVAGDAKGFTSVWDPRRLFPGFKPAAPTAATTLAQALQSDKDLRKLTAAHYRGVLAKSISHESYQLATGRQADVIRDVFNPAHARFVASLFGLPLSKSFDESDLVELLSAIYVSASEEQCGARQFSTAKKRQQTVQELAKQVQAQVPQNGTAGLQSHSTNEIRDHGRKAIETAAKGESGTSALVWNQILPLAATVFVTQSRAFAESLDYVLGEGQEQLKELQQLTDPSSAEGQAKFQSFAREICRLRPSVALYRRATQATTVVDGDRKVEIAADQLVICDMTKAARDGSAISEAGKFDTSRGQDLGESVSFGVETSLCAQLSSVSVAVMLEAISRLPGVSRAPGSVGVLRRIHGQTVTYLNVEESKNYSYPRAMKVNWQG